jgi:hypothetical protein
MKNRCKNSETILLNNTPMRYFLLFLAAKIIEFQCSRRKLLQIKKAPLLTVPLSFKFMKELSC